MLGSVAGDLLVLFLNKALSSPGVWEIESPKGTVIAKNGVELPWAEFIFLAVSLYVKSLL